MAVNLIRNARVFFSSNVNTTTGELITTGTMTASNTFEIQVLDGMTFSQETNVETVTLNESGTTPNRGQEGFNTSLNPASFSFSTYLKPARETTVTNAEEAPLWNAFSSASAISVAGGWTAGVAGTSPAEVDFSASNANTLQKFALIIAMDDQTFVIQNCVLGEATIDFGLDGIATIAWTGQGSTLLRLDKFNLTEASGEVTLASSDLTGTNKAKARIVQNTFYLANKLSVAELVYGGNTYTLAITGGSITMSNNITYLTPANIGVVNKPFTSFTGTRAVSGSLSAYLRTGAGETGNLFDALVTDSATTAQPIGTFKLSIGGTGAVRVDLEAGRTMFSIPTINTEQVVGTTINFTCMGTDIDTPDEITISYYVPAA